MLGSEHLFFTWSHRQRFTLGSSFFSPAPEKLASPPPCWAAPRSQSFWNTKTYGSIALHQCPEPPGPSPLLQHPEPPWSITPIPVFRTTRVHRPEPPGSNALSSAPRTTRVHHPFSSVQNHQGPLPLLQHPEPPGPAPLFQCPEPPGFIAPSPASRTTRVHHAFSSAQNHQGPSPLLQYPEPPVLGAGVRHSAHGKGHEEGGSTYAKAGSSLRSLPGNPRASTPITRACLLYYFALSPTPLTLRGAVPHHLFRRRS